MCMRVLEFDVELAGVFHRGIDRAKRSLLNGARRVRDRAQATYSNTACSLTGLGFATSGEIPCEIEVSALEWLSRRYIEHRFDLLGSGWTTVERGKRCRGFGGHRYYMGAAVAPDKFGRWLSSVINPQNLRVSQEVWSLVDDGYHPIDWQLDFKSGFRWSERTWYADIRYGRAPGADIKVPWELGRMQHLPQLGASAVLSHRGLGKVQPQVCGREFRNQVLDFIACNPPRFGVNWASSMDVAIRLANWLLAYSFLKAAGISFDSAFDEVFATSVVDHGRHIASNLEWHRGRRNNHYLANVVGLLFASAFCDAGAESKRWGEFGEKALLEEIEYQFHGEGTNFEGSVSYHRLSAEIAAYGIAVVLGLRARRPQSDPEAFPKSVAQRIAGMVDFADQIQKPTGRVPQIGDDDAGRFVKLNLSYNRLTVAQAKAFYDNLAGYDELSGPEQYWDEDFLDHRHLGAAIGALFDDKERSSSLDSWAIRNLAGSSRIDRVPAASCAPLTRGSESALSREGSEWRLFYSLPLGPETPSRFAYPQFGIYLFRASGVYVAIRCAEPGLEGGHGHQDALSIEVWAHGRDVFRDPGTFTYTPSPQLRLSYWGYDAHAGVAVALGMHNRSFRQSVFGLTSTARSTCTYFGARGFAGQLFDDEGPIAARRVLIENGKLAVEDLIFRKSRLARIRIPHAPSYGKRCAEVGHHSFKSHS